MTNQYFLSFIALCLFTMLSCKKEDVAETNTSNDIVPLTIDATKKAHFNENNQRYESNQFSENNNTHLYALQPTPTVTYRVLIYGLYMEDVSLTLLRGNETIETGVQANVGLTAKFLTFEATSDDEVIIRVENLNESNNGETFYLTVEEIGTYTLTWQGQTWLCDGDWEVNQAGFLEFQGYGSGFTKWARLTDPIDSSYTANFSFMRLASTNLDYVGTAAHASDDIHTMTNLPATCKQFKIGSDDWELWTVNLGSGGGVGRETGTLPSPLNVADNHIQVEVGQDSIQTKVNGEHVTSTISSSTNGYFYLTVEESSTTSTLFKNFELE